MSAGAVLRLPSVAPASKLSRSLTLSSSFRGLSIRRAPVAAIKASAPCRTQFVVKAVIEAEADAPAQEERLRLFNLSPQPGSKRKAKRKGRGIAAGQGASCGFGMRGQKARSGPNVRPGFEGGQMPLYRRLPKLKGIAGGMSAGLPKYVTVNVGDIAECGFEEGEEVTLDALKEIGLLKPTGRERTLPLKILGEGEMDVKLVIKAEAFSESAREKLEQAGCTLEVLPGRKKFVGGPANKNKARAQAYFAAKNAEVPAAA